MFFSHLHALNQRVRDDRGSVMGEYAVLFALITVALLVTIGLFVQGIINTFQAVIDVLP